MRVQAPTLGPSAISMINELEPDVVFLDVQMPGASGIDVVAKLKRETVDGTWCT